MISPEKLEGLVPDKPMTRQKGTIFPLVGVMFGLAATLAWSGTLLWFAGSAVFSALLACCTWLFA